MRIAAIGQNDIAISFTQVQLQSVIAQGEIRQSEERPISEFDFDAKNSYTLNG